MEIVTNKLSHLADAMQMGLGLIGLLVFAAVMYILVLLTKGDKE